MKITPTARRGFTLLELLIVITIISLLSAALYSTFGYFRKKARKALAQNTMSNLAIALTQYRTDWGSFPPDDKPTANGSEMIAFYLARVLKVEGGEMHYGPYLKIPDNQLVDASGAPAGPISTETKRFLSPLGGEYTYSIQVDSKQNQFAFVLVDPGADKQLGGDVNRTTGFKVTSPKDAEDNIYNEAQIAP